MQGLGGARTPRPPRTVKNLCITLDSPKTQLLRAYCWPEALPITYTINTYFVCFFIFFDIPRLHSSPASFFKWSQISKIFSTIFTEKNLHKSRPEQFKPLLFKGQLYLKSKLLPLPHHHIILTNCVPGRSCKRADTSVTACLSHKLLIWVIMWYVSPGKASVKTEHWSLWGFTWATSTVT